jgi:hypothetical protein
VALFQRQSAASTAEGEPLVVDLPRAGKVLIQFTAAAMPAGERLQTPTPVF